MSLRRLTTVFALAAATLLSAQEEKKPAFHPAPEQPRRPTVTLDSISTFETFWNDKVKAKLAAKKDTTNRKKTGNKTGGALEFKKSFDGIYLRPNIKTPKLGLKDARVGILNTGRSNPVLNYTVFPTAEKDSSLVAKRKFNEPFLVFGGAIDLGTQDITFSPALGYAPGKGFVFGANADAYVNAGGEYQTHVTAHAFFGSLPASPEASAAAPQDPDAKTKGILTYGFGVDRFLGGDNNFNNLYMTFQSYGRPGETFNIGVPGLDGRISERHERATVGHERTLGCFDLRRGSYDLTGAFEIFAQRDAVVRDYGRLNFRHVDAEVSFGVAAAGFVSLGSQARLGLRVEQGLTRDPFNSKSSGTSVAIAVRKNLRAPNLRILQKRAQF